MLYDVFRRKNVRSGGRDVTASLYGVKSHKTPFGSVDRHIEAKLVKYQHLHVIENTILIPAKFWSNKSEYSLLVVHTRTLFGARDLDVHLIFQDVLILCLYQLYVDFFH